MRSLVAVALSRRVTLVSFYLLVAVVAALALYRLPVTLLPPLRFPGLLVWTEYPDVAPSRVERAVTEPVEQALAGIAGVQRITGRSQLGGSLVRLDLGWNANLDLALLDVRQQLDRMAAALPEEAGRPVVLRLDPSDRPILLVALYQDGGTGNPGEPPGAARAPGEDLVQLKQVGREVVARRLEQLPGVARVQVTGGFDRQIEVDLDVDRLHSHGIDLAAVETALARANVAITGGVVRRGPYRYAVEVSGEFARLEDLAEVVIPGPGEARLRLRDLARVRDGVADRRGLVRLDGRETLLLLVERRPDANIVETAARVREALGEMRRELPGVGLSAVVDESVFVEESIAGLVGAIWTGGLLSVLVLFVFIRGLRPVLAVAVALPLSLAITFILFDLLDVSLNLISLAGLALGVGMLVDNAIVVVENIARLRETGKSAREAALEGAAEVGPAITASTLTTLAVFVPLTFVEGLAGRLFRDQSLAVACSLLASLFVALTAVPVLAGSGPAPRAGVRTARWILLYEHLLDLFLAHRRKVLLASLVSILGGIWLALGLPRQVVPGADQGRIEISLSSPAGTDLPHLGTLAAGLERSLLGRPGIEHVLADLGERDEARLDLDPRPPYAGDLTLVLAPGHRGEALLPALARLPWPPGVTRQVRPVRTQLEVLLLADDVDLTIDLLAGQRAEAERLVAPLVARLARSGELVNVARAHASAVPAYRLSFDREAVARFGLDLRELTGYLEAAARGRLATRFQSVNESVPILLKLPAAEDVNQLLEGRIQTSQGLLPLAVFVRAEPVTLPASLVRENQVPVVRIEADLAPGQDLKAGVARAEEALRGVLPPSVRGRVGGANEAFQSGLRAAGWSLLLSVLLVYLILAAQFESLLQPLIVLMDVPLALAPVALTLALTGQGLNLMSLIGCIVLVGICVNDSIVKIDFINRRRRKGSPLLDAVHAAGRDRVRPIVMTALTTVLGLLPMAFGLGSGGELRAPLAIALIGGLVGSTLLTLLVTPLIYVTAARLGERLGRRR